MKKIILIIFCLFITACGANQSAPKKMYIDKLDNISEDEKRIIFQAARRVNEEAGETLISFSKTETGKPVVFRSLVQTELSDDPSILAHARYFEYHCLVEVRSDLKQTIMRSFLGRLNYQEGDYEALVEKDRRRVDDGMEFALMHELGHCLGLDHSDDIEDIMYPAIQPAWDQMNVDMFVDRIKRLFF